MTHALDDDLRRWVDGELPLEELVASHPGTDVGGVVALHGRLSRIAMAPVPDADASWGRLRDRLSGVVPGRRVGLRIPRRVVAAVAAVMLMASAAYAVSPETVTDVAGDLVQGIGSLFRGNDGAQGSSGPAPAPGEQGATGKDPVEGSANGDDQPEPPSDDAQGGTGTEGDDYEDADEQSDDPGDDGSGGSGSGDDGDEGPDDEGSGSDDEGSGSDDDRSGSGGGSGDEETEGAGSEQD